MGVNAVVLPGIGGAGAGHWQMIWAAADPAMVVLEPSSWDLPNLDDWCAALDRAVFKAKKPPLLIAHSLSCLLIAHWAARAGSRASGAFMVGVPDPDGPAFPKVEAPSFRNPPVKPLPFPSLMVASTNDRYSTADYSRRRAQDWNAGLVIAGELGHINEASGLGRWEQGEALLTAFRTGIGS